MIASVSHISLLLGFKNTMRRYSRSEIREKISQQLESYDLKYCKKIGHSDNKLTTQETERENRIVKAAKIFFWLIPKVKCAKFFIRVQKTDLHPVKFLIFLQTKIFKKC